MQQQAFIFSNEPRYRWARHLSFWAAWWLFQGFLYSFISINNTTQFNLRLPASLAESLIYLIVHAFLSYSLMYFVVPRFLLKGRYWLTTVWVVILFLLTAALSAGLSVTIIPEVRMAIIGQSYAEQYRTPTLNIHLALMAGLRGAITVGGIAAAIKLMKLWYMKEQRNLQLQKENVAAQLQVLKAQVHPHFLFNTLNNIYAYTQTTSPVASSLVIGLSDMLRYMLYECNQPLVPLSKEIKMLRDYCSLEQVRYDQHLDLQVNIAGDKGEVMIAPLLLLPFMENAFKHGASHLLEAAWISLSINVEGDTLKMKLINSKPIDTTTRNDGSQGLGISNVQTRLNFLYPNRHELSITNEEELFIVNLTVKLEKATSRTPVEALTNKTEYALT
ncbi:MAG: histidine kinase [Bacteroidota bacterium]|nr:histidine kinase [Ferruginibacter sp.]